MGVPLVEGHSTEPQRQTKRLSDGVSLLVRALGPYAEEVLPPNLRVVRLQRGFYHGGRERIFRGNLNNGSRIFVATETDQATPIQTDKLTKIIVFYNNGSSRIYNPETGEAKTYPRLVGAPEPQEPFEEIKRDLNFGSPDFIQQFKP